jgi:predicted amidohydrolase YtcJ
MKIDMRYADNVFLNGKVITVDGDFSICQAVATRDGIIIATGRNTDVRSLIGKNTRVIDLKGKVMLPGINDCHTHAALFGGTRPPLMLDLTFPTVKSIKDIVKLVAERVKTAAPGEWIRGFGWDEGYLVECLQDRTHHPTRWDLDAISPDNPVCLGDFSVHSLWLNSKALELAGITRDTPVPVGGDIVKDSETGDVTGIINELAAQGMVMKVIPPWTRAQKRAAILTAIKIFNELGITSITEGALGPGGVGYQGGLLDSECIGVYNDLYDEGKLDIRVNIFYLFGEYGACSYKDFQRIIPALGIHSGFGNEWIKIGGVKIFADGIPLTRTAWLSEEYAGGGRGSLVVPGNTEQERREELDRMINLAHHHNFQVGVHAIGDMAIAATIDSFIKAEKNEPKGLRHYIVHADFISPEYARIAGQNNIAICAQPGIQWTLADASPYLVGPERAARQWPYKTLLDAGARLTGSSDTPCIAPHWLQGIESAVLRESKATGKITNPSQCINREQVIRMYTISAAWQDHMENRKGSIESGKLADLCVLGEDILSVEAHSIKDIPVMMTVVGGRVVYEKRDF